MNHMTELDTFSNLTGEPLLVAIDAELMKVPAPVRASVLEAIREQLTDEQDAEVAREIERQRSRARGTSYVSPKTGVVVTTLFF